MASILGPDLSKGIGQLLQEKRLRVPKYQRSYAWKKQQVNELFRDLRRAIERDKQYYFLGAIVGCEVEDRMDAAEIVDGQQRLATTTILLAAIRDEFVAMKDEKAATRFEGDYLFKTEGFENPVTEPRLSLNDTDDDFFQKRILSRPDTPERSIQAPRLSHRLIADAAKPCDDWRDGGHRLLVKGKKAIARRNQGADYPVNKVGGVED